MGKFYIHLDTNMVIGMVPNTLVSDNQWCTGSSQIANVKIGLSTGNRTLATKITR
jgi:hypothetical protein